jgi:hypothetical protein
MSQSKEPRKKKVVVTRGKKAKRKTPSVVRKGSKAADDGTFQLLFTKKNYMWVLIGLGFMFLGFLLMLGGEQSSPEVWEPEKIYSFRRITLAPFLILVGLGIQIYAIFKK